MRDIITEINEKLDEIERNEGVRILHAVESGSRAWGFASPDSDYDVRFVYVRPKEDYLRLDESRDVIEWQLDEVLDINGWDLKKALRQFAKGNATLFEWNGSPIVYRTTEEWARIKEVSKQYFSEKAAVYHYYGTANSTLQGYLLGDTVRYKKYFYALRPLLAAQYIEKYHTAPPVLFDDLLKMELPEELRQAIDELLEAKKRTTEGEENPQMPAIREFIENETARQKEIANSLRDDHNKNYAELNRIFADTIAGKDRKMFRKMRRFKQQISEEECIRILKEQPRGVLSMIGDDGYPYGIPLDHLYSEEDGKLYFHCAREGHKLDAIKRCDKISYCVMDQGYRREGEWALNIKSVVIFGRIHVVEDEDRKRKICTELCRKFTDDEEYLQKELKNAFPRVCCMELIPEHMTGKLVNES